MHDDAVEPDAWARAIEPVFRPGDGTAAGTKRSTEMIYRAWDTLQQLSDEGATVAREVLTCFLNEFERDFLSGNRNEDLRKVAEQFCESLVELPAGEFQMGAPPEKQGVSDDVRKHLEEFLRQEGDPAARAESLVDQLYSYTPGKSGQEQRRGDIAWWTRILRDNDLDAVVRNQYPLHETPEEPIQQVSDFLLARWPTINAWYRLFSPEHGAGEVYYREKYSEVSPEINTPAIFVSWYDAWAFCKWAHWEQRSCRLPREHEWEYAAKAGTPWKQNYWWGDEFDGDKCNGDNRVGRTTPPTDDHANPWELGDMLGNVWEWTADEYRKQYHRDKPAESSARVLRGGSWYNNALNCRSACRNNGLPTVSFYYGGFRVARARRS